jgi:hypothetical protein
MDKEEAVALNFCDDLNPMRVQSEAETSRGREGLLGRRE